MTTVKLGSKGEDVKTLQKILGLTPDGSFGPNTEKKVKEWQKSKGLVVDGIIGPKSWEILLKQQNTTSKTTTTQPKQDMYAKCAAKIGCEVAALKAVKQVETGGKAAFITDGKPSILFEGHIFYKELKARGINPANYRKGNEDIIYQSWTKAYYKGGLKEYDRLNRARKINKDAADASASWGMFQIMGNNYKACGCKSVSEFVTKMCTSEEEQLMLSTNFIINNPNLKNALIKKDWKTFARYYNGPAYAQNQYDKKLLQAYNKLKTSK